MPARKTAAPSGKPPLENASDQTPTESPEDQLPPGEAADDENPEESSEKSAETLAHEAHIAALKRERAGYARYGREDRVAEVDAELERYGPQPPATG